MPALLGVVILGMHRSRTSPITRLVSLLGMTVCRRDDARPARCRRSGVPMSRSRRSRHRRGPFGANAARSVRTGKCQPASNRVYGSPERAFR